MRWFNRQPKRNALQQKALKIALRIYNSDPEKYKNTMFCPYCGQPLIKSGNQRNFQTLSEHVSCPNSTPIPEDEYICSAEGLFNGQFLFKNDPDTQIGCKFGILHAWNGGWEKGGNYVSEYWRKLIGMSKDSIVNKLVIDSYLHEDYQNEFSSALNTFECQTEISIYKKGLPDKVKLPTWLTFNIIQLTLDYSYEADEFGVVKKTWVCLGFLKKDKHFSEKEFSIIGQWPWHTWNFLYRIFNRQRKNAIKRHDIKSLKECYEPARNTAWIYRMFHWYITHRHFIEYRKLMNSK